MKNLNKVLAMVLVVVMAMSSVVFADFSDVTDETTYAEAINVGAALGLFTGYPDGTFMPEGNITRAEYAAIVVRALNQEAQAASAANAPSDFIDVTDDHWGKGYINIVSKLGIVNGYGDGNFGPEDLILYEDAIKMLVVALGYEPSIGAAGYPVGYLTKASEIGLLTGVIGTNGVAANRGIVAQLTVNALNVPLMKQVGYGTWVDYEVQDGVYNLHRTLLSDNLGLVKLTAEVSNTSLVDTTAAHIDEYVTVKVINNFKTRFAYENGGDNKELNEDKTTRVYVGETAASSLVGNKAVIYAAYDELEQELVALFAAKDTTKTYEVVIAASDLAGVTAESDYIELKYWENETDKKPEIVEIAEDASVYVNGTKASAKDADEIVAELWKSNAPVFYGVVTLQLLDDKDATIDYDTIFIEDIETIVVDENNTARYKLTAKNDVDAVYYDPTDKTVSAILYDENGAEMDWADLVEYDVVSIKRSVGNNGKDLVEGTKISSKITGTVTGIDNAGEADVKYYIGGEAYGAYYEDTANLEIQNQDTGDFYLDIVGNIAYFEATESINTNYAYVVNIGGTGTGLEEKNSLKLFTFDGQYGTFETASKVKVDGVTGIKSAELADPIVVTSFDEDEFKALKKKQGTACFSHDKDAKELTIDAIAAGDIITFTTNSSGYITSIDRPTDRDDFDKDKQRGKFTYADNDGVELEYNEKSASFTGSDAGKVYVNENTVIMVAEAKGKSATEDDFMLFSAANLADEQIFTNARVFNVDTNKNAGLIVVESAVDVATSGTILAVVTGIGSGNNDEGDDIWNVKVVQDGLVKDGAANPFLTTVDDTVEFEQYATIIPKYNALGELTNKTATLVTVGSDEVEFKTAAITAGIVGDDDDEKGRTTVDYIYGTVDEIDRKTVKLTNGKEIDVDNKTIVYVYDNGLNSKNRVLIDGIDYVDYDEDTDKIYVGSGKDDTCKVQILAREYDGDITEVVMYVFRNK